MKKKDTLTTLFEHNLWANTRLLEFCTALKPAQLDDSIKGTYGSILATLEHLVRSERSYLHRIQTRKPYAHVAGAQAETMPDLLASAQKSGRALVEVAATVDAKALVEVSWANDQKVNVPLDIFLTQSINHATEHRAQIMATLTQIGIEPPSLDAWSFFEATGFGT